MAVGALHTVMSMSYLSYLTREALNTPPSSTFYFKQSVYVRIIFDGVSSQVAIKESLFINISICNAVEIRILLLR